MLSLPLFYQSFIKIFDKRINLQTQDYIRGLRQHDDAILRIIYSEYSEQILHFITENGGTPDDAKDIFQDALMIIYEKVQAPDFQLTSSFYTFLFGICKLIFANHRRKKDHQTVTILNDATLKGSENIEEAILERELDNIYRENFKKLPSTCQKLLNLFFEKKKMTAITKDLNLKNEHAARTKKYRCQERLKKLIEQDARYIEITQKQKV